MADKGMYRWDGTSLEILASPNSGGGGSTPTGFGTGPFGQDSFGANASSTQPGGYGQEPYGETSYGGSTASTNNGGVYAWTGTALVRVDLYYWDGTKLVPTTTLNYAPQN